MATAQATDVEAALAVLAAKVWGVLTTADVTDTDTWNDALAWVRMGQRISASTDGEHVEHVNDALPPVPLPFP